MKSYGFKYKECLMVTQILWQENLNKLPQWEMKLAMS